VRGAVVAHAHARARADTIAATAGRPCCRGRAVARERAATQRRRLCDRAKQPASPLARRRHGLYGATTAARPREAAV
jgi:hypothetical protein